MLSHYSLNPSKREETRVEVLQEMLTLAKQRKEPKKTNQKNRRCTL